MQTYRFLAAFSVKLPTILYRLRIVFVHHISSPVLTILKFSSSYFLSIFKTKMAGRAAQNATKRWLGDKGTWPVLVTCIAAAGLCTAQCVRYLSGHPDVNWNKQNRQDIFRYKGDAGADWQSHRRKIATMHKNAINEAKGLNK